MTRGSKQAYQVASTLTTGGGRETDHVVEKLTTVPEFSAEALERLTVMKRRATNLINAGLASGRVVKPDRCEACGAEGRVDGHHDDYSDGYSVRWLCRRCHLAYHDQLRQKWQKLLPRKRHQMTPAGLASYAGRKNHGGINGQGVIRLRKLKKQGVRTEELTPEECEG